MNHYAFAYIEEQTDKYITLLTYDSNNIELSTTLYFNKIAHLEKSMMIIKYKGEYILYIFMDKQSMKNKIYPIKTLSDAYDKCKIVLKEKFETVI